MSGFDPTNPFAAPSPAQPAGAAAAPNPFGSDPFGGDSNPFQAPAAPGAGAGRQRAGTSPFVAAVPDPFASASQRRASEAVPPSPWGSAIGSDAFAAAPVAPSVRPSDPFVSVASDFGGDPRKESVTVFGVPAGAGAAPSGQSSRRTSRADLDMFDPLAGPGASGHSRLALVPEVASASAFSAPAPATATTSPFFSAPQPVGASAPSLPARTFTPPAAPVVGAGAPPPVPVRSAATESAKGGATFTPMPSYTTQSSLRDPDSHTSVVSEAMEKYSVSAVLEGVSRRQTMTVGSTAEEEHRDRAGGLEDKQFVGYRGYFGYEREGFSSTNKREFRVRKSPQTAIRITLKDNGISVCRCPTSCGASHAEVSFLPYANLTRIRHIQTDSKKGYHYIVLETSDGELFVIYSQETKMIKAGINTRYNASKGSGSESPAFDSSATEKQPSLGTISPTQGAMDDPFGGADVFSKPAQPPASQDEWWK